MCAPVEHDAPERRASAEPITAVVASRVRELRRSSGLSQAAVAERMTKYGVPWTRLTVVNLERRVAQSRGSGAGRDAVTLQELLALALVFDVPPILLVADPRSADPVPVAEGVEPDPWRALFWLIGKQSLTGRDGAAWSESALMLEQVFLVVSLVDRFHRLRQDLALEATDDGWDSDQAAERERNVLAQLAVPMGKLRGWSMPVPPVPEDIRDRARDLNVELPGGEG